MNKALDRVIPKIAIPLIALAGTLLVFIMLNQSQGTNAQNNAYIRVINCIVSYHDVTRTSGNIEECYVQVEKDLNVHLQRYDSSDD